MPHIRALASRLARLSLAGCVYTLASFGLHVGLAAAAPTAVTLEVQIDNGSWIPLPAEDMKSATADAAIARISEGGWLRITPSGSAGIEGSLTIDISLVSKAQVAKAVMTLEVPREATYVSNASISVRGLDGQGFHRAFEHVGREAADRLHSMMAARRGGPTKVVDDLDDQHWRDVYNEAQTKKHAGSYDEAKVLFEQVVAASGPGTARLAEMARDELRYGLPVMQARQTLVGLSSPGGRHDFPTLLTRAEGLYRQILGENPTDVTRMQEAQQALDQIVVARNAFEQAKRTQVILRVQQTRMMMTEFLMMEGVCPDRAQVEGLMAHDPFELRLGSVTGGGGESASYSIIDAETGISVPVKCSRRGIEFDLGGVPARHGR